MAGALRAGKAKRHKTELNRGQTGDTGPGTIREEVASSK